MHARLLKLKREKIKLPLTMPHPRADLFPQMPNPKEDKVPTNARGAGGGGMRVVGIDGAIISQSLLLTSTRFPRIL